MDKKLTPTATCFIVAIGELESRGKIASMEGIIKIISGELDEETVSFKDMVGFASSLSIKKKRGKNLLHSLVRKGYLDQRYIEGDYFLALSESGKEVAIMNRDKVLALSFKSKKEKKATIIDIN